MRMESHLFGMLIDQLYLQVCSPALLHLPTPNMSLMR